MSCAAIIAWSHACGESSDTHATADKPAAPATDRPEKAADEASARHGLSAEQAATPLVTVGDTVITVGDFADQLADQSPYLQARYASPERRREFLENMIRFELLAQEAARRGLDKRPEVAEVKEQAMVQAMMAELFDEGAIRPEEISEAEIKRYYQEHPQEFRAPAQVRASQIVVRTQARADDILERLLAEPPPGDMATFHRLAKRYNEDSATKKTAGDLHFFGQRAADDSPGSERHIPVGVREAAFSLENIGQVYPQAVQTEQGFVVLKLTAKRDALDRSLEDASRMIRNRLFREKREKAIETFIAELRDKADIEEDLSRLNELSEKAQAQNSHGTSP